jgi:hypothetical protein
LIAGCVAAAVLLLGGCGTTTKTESPSSRSYSFWPAFPAEPRVQFLVSYQYSDDVEPPMTGLERLAYGEDREVLPINKPYGLEMYDGKIYVCDIRNSAVMVLDLRKQQTRVMGASGMGRMSKPSDIAIAPDGTMYVTDVGRNVIFVYDKNERHVNSFGHGGFKPAGIDVFGDELYICDFVSQQVLVMDRNSGEVVRTIGEKGDKDGQFVRPLGVAVDPDGNVHVTDVIRCRVQTFSPSGRLISAYGTIGDNIGNFVRPKQIAVDNQGISYVVDAAFANVQLFDKDDKLLMFFGAAGDHPGSMDLPAGISVHEGDVDLFSEYIHPAFKAERLVLVTNQFGPQKVGVYALGQLRAGKTARDVATSRASVKSGLLEGDEQQNVPGGVDKSTPLPKPEDAPQPPPLPEESRRTAPKPPKEPR